MVPDRIRFRLDRRAKWITAIALIAICCGIAVLFYTSGGSYLPAWFSTLIIALFLFALLSVPRFIHVSPHSVEIHCMMELVKIPIHDIREIRVMEPSEMRHSMPVFGIYGLLGYYGYYYNLDEYKLFKIYGSQWRGFVLIEDIYEEQVVVTCANPEEFIEAVKQYM